MSLPENHWYTGAAWLGRRGIFGISFTHVWLLSQGETLGIGPVCTAAKSCWVSGISKEQKKGAGIVEKWEHEVKQSSGASATAWPELSTPKCLHHTCCRVVKFCFSNYKQNCQMKKHQARHKVCSKLRPLDINLLFCNSKSQQRCTFCLWFLGHCALAWSLTVLTYST